MKFLDFLKANSNSFGHLVMSLAFLIFLAIVILLSHDSNTVTFAASMMTMLFGYWFGSQSTAIKHQDTADIVKEAQSGPLPAVPPATPKVPPA